MEPICQGCLERDARLARLEQELVEAKALLRALQAEVRELKARLGQNSSNSSIPPSANPPQAPPPVRKKPTGRKPGGQPGHAAYLRRLLPPERVATTHYFFPDICTACQDDLPEAPGPDDPEPRRHQTLELPPTPVIVTEYQAHGRHCRNCGELNWATLPLEIVHAPVCDARLTGIVAFFSGVAHLSKRLIEETLDTVFGAPIALGTIGKLEQEVSAALASAHAEAQRAVQEADAKNVDETGWKQAGQRRWLWAAATQRVACFVIAPTRGALGLTALLGAKIRGIVSSDRWSVYGQLRLGLRQLCWAHLKRDFQKLVDRGGESQEVGDMGLGVVEILFERWHCFRGGTLTRAQLQRDLAPFRQTLKDGLERGCACADAKTAAFCGNLLKLESAMWTFMRQEGVEPTNNHIERLLRSGVLWRKNAFGCHREAGCRFVERILTVAQTLRLQKRPVLEFLHQAILAQRQDREPPRLLLAG